jgi:hypothetical protein
MSDGLSTRYENNTIFWYAYATVLAVDQKRTLFFNSFSWEKHFGIVHALENLESAALIFHRYPMWTPTTKQKPPTKKVEKGRTSVPCAQAVEKTTGHYWLRRLSNAIRFGVEMDFFFNTLK